MSALASKVSPRRLTTLAGILLGLAMLLLGHRNWGIDHDAALYLGLALNQRWPEIYSNDLFFAYGSQGNYTLFPWLLGHLLAFVRPVQLFQGGGVIGLLLFAGTSWYAISKLVRGHSRYLAWLGVICLPSNYGQAVLFSYAEPFLTPRPFSEAACLLAVGLLTQNKLKPAIACLVVAFVFHPLQAIAASMILWSWLVLSDRRWLHCLWLAVPVLIAGFLGIAPLEGMVRAQDPTWLGELDSLHQHLFITNWSSHNFEILTFDILVLAYAWHVWRVGFGNWCLAALVGLGLGMGASLIMVDGLHLILPTGLQLWRAHWLAHWFAMAAFALLLLGAGRRDITRSLLLALAGILAWTQPGWMWLPVAAAYLAWPRVQGYLQPRIHTLLILVLSCTLLLLFFYDVALAWIAFVAHDYRLDAYPIDQKVAVSPLIALGFPLLLTYVWRHSKERTRWALTVGLILPLVAIGIIRWDSRSPMRRAVEAEAFRSDIFSIQLPQNAEVFWEGQNIVETWLVLRRADYYDPQQLSGIAFQPGTIVHARKRITKLTPLLDMLDACDARPVTKKLEACSIPDDAIASACSAAPPKAPDFLVLKHRLRFPSAGQWTVRDRGPDEKIITYWIYDCLQLRKSLPTAIQPSRNYPPRLY